MDDDQSGLLEEPEIKKLAIALGQKLTQNEVVAGTRLISRHILALTNSQVVSCAVLCCARLIIVARACLSTGDSYGGDGR